MPDCLLDYMGISSVAHHNPYINVFVVCLLMQERFIDKIHFFKFFFMIDKPWLDQLKIITGNICNLCGTSFSWKDSVPSVQGREKTNKEGEYPVLRTNTKPQQLTKHTKISYSIASLAFRKVSCGTYRNGLNQGTSKLRYYKYLKKYEPC